VFSSGTTISSSQMNENFRFLASEVRETGVYCDSGDTISEAINAGYNSLIIYGACNEPFSVYRLDPRPYGVSFSDMPNKPISYLLIRGGSGTGADSISVPAGSNFDIMVGDNAYVMLYQITLNGQVYMSGGATLRVEASTINGHVEVNNNSTFFLKESDLNGNTDNPPLRVKASSHAEIDNSDIVGSPTGYQGIWLWNNASLMMQGTSSLSTPSGIDGLNLNVNSSAVILDTVQITSVDRNAISIDENSSVELNSNVLVSRTDNSGSDIFVGPTSSLNINGSDINLGSVGCGEITAYVQNDGNSASIDSTCNGYENLSSGGGSGSRSVYDGNNNRIGEFISYTSTSEILARSNDGFMFKINTQGYISGVNDGAFYYASTDCSGEPYIHSGSFSSPKGVFSVIDSGSPPSGDLYYSGESEYLVYQSVKFVSSDSCFAQSSSGTELMMKIYPNDSAVTGVSSFTITTPILLD
jgi:hypothetical protein